MFFLFFQGNFLFLLGLEFVLEGDILFNNLFKIGLMRKFYVFLVVFFIAFVVVSPFDSAAQQRAGHKTRHVPRQTEILFFVPEDIVYNDIADVLKRPEE